jgi:hypothetical protein
MMRLKDTFERLYENARYDGSVIGSVLEQVAYQNGP